MEAKRIEDHTCSACSTCTIALGVQDRQWDSCRTELVAETRETKRTHEQMRLLLSRDAVLSQFGPNEPGSSPW
jgi:hypothetical protein